MNETTYTTADFRAATQAHNPETGLTATRNRKTYGGSLDPTHPWQVSGVLPDAFDYASDWEMFRYGFVPGAKEADAETIETADTAHHPETKHVALRCGEDEPDFDEDFPWISETRHSPGFPDGTAISDDSELREWGYVPGPVPEPEEGEPEPEEKVTYSPDDFHDHLEAHHPDGRNLRRYGGHSFPVAYSDAKTGEGVSDLAAALAGFIPGPRPEAEEVDQEETPSAPAAHDFTTATQAHHPETGATASKSSPLDFHAWNSDSEPFPDGTDIGSDSELLRWGYVPGPKPESEPEVTYSEDDFRPHSEAHHPDGRNLRRSGNGEWPCAYFDATSRESLSDMEVAGAGFIPGPRPESEEVDQSDDEPEDIGTGKSRQRLIEHISELDSVIRRRNVTITELRSALTEAEKANESDDTPDGTVTAYKEARTALLDMLIRPADGRIHDGEKFVELFTDGRISGPHTLGADVPSEGCFGFVRRLLAPRPERDPEWWTASAVRATRNGERKMFARVSQFGDKSNHGWYEVGAHVRSIVASQARREFEDVEIVEA